MIIKPDDMFPHAGCRLTINWFAKHGLDWAKFRTDGIELSELEATGDHSEKVALVAANARRRLGLADGQA